MNKFEEAINKQIEKRSNELVLDEGEHIIGEHTIGEFIRAVFSINNELDAHSFYNGYIEWLNKLPDDEHFTKIEIAQRNIGWCFGEGMSSNKIDMWRKVCNAFHPVFG
jgi:hypothetical protein